MNEKKLRVSGKRLPVLFINEETLINYLKLYGRGAGSIDHEIAAAVWTKRLFEKARNDPHILAFELREPLEKLKPDFDSSNPKDIRYVLDRRKTDTPFDFFIVKGTVEDHEAKGLAFQLKRFGKGIEQNFIDGFIKYLNKTLLKYSPGEAGLIVIPEPDKSLPREERDYLEKNGIPVEIFDERITVPKDSFKKVFVLGKDSRRFYIREIKTGGLYIDIDNPMS